MWPLSPHWHDPLAPKAPGTVSKVAAGLRVRQVGSGESAVVFIHGLAASLRYWGTAYDRLARDSRLVFIDLLGFGGSDKPPGAYDLELHSTTVSATLDELGICDATVVGHSTGAAVAMKLAESSSSVGRVVALAPPIFPSVHAARRHLAKLGYVQRSLAEGTELAMRMCRFMCDHRELSRKLAPLLVPRLPAPVASDGVDHTWESISKTFESLVRDFDARPWARELGDRLLLVHGSEDRIAPRSAANKTLTGADVRMETVAGDHHFPLSRPRACLHLIESTS